MQKKPTFYRVTKFKTIRELLEIADKEAGKKIAFQYKIKDEVKSVTYHEFVNQTELLGASLTEAGFGSSTVACISENRYEWIVTYLTVLQSAGVFVPIDKEMPPADIFQIIKESECSVVFYSKKYEVMLMENVDKLPGVKAFIGFDREEETDNFLSFEKRMEHGKSLDKQNYKMLASAPDALKLLVYTSGTTGSSKGVMLSEQNLVSSVYYGMQVSTVYDKCLSVLPYHHTYEAVSGILVSLHKHATICINDSLKAVLKNLQLYKPSYLYLVPAFAESFYMNIMRIIKNEGKETEFNQLILWSNRLRKTGIDLRKTLFQSIHKSFGGRLRKIVCGGAPIRPEIGKFFDDIGISLINGYGITECSPLVCANNDFFSDYHTVGIQLPCAELKIDNPNEEGIGEICVKGAIVMLGYYKKPEETAEVLKDGWFYTGDYGYLNSYQQLLITGRKKNMIVLNTGKNVYPEEIEGYIQGLDYVEEVVVKGVKNEHGEEVSLLAEVFLSVPKTEKEVLMDIHEACSQLPSYKRVSTVVIRTEEFPKTTSKKIKRSSI